MSDRRRRRATKNTPKPIQKPIVPKSGNPWMIASVLVATGMSVLAYLYKEGTRSDAPRLRKNRFFDKTPPSDPQQEVTFTEEQMTDKYNPITDYTQEDAEYWETVDDKWK
eukprot:TRINITY_DN3472_c1_g1_i2.p1 TRINITY_DN3472_c1_g1~~TRINITY_DN3472_c1_g1_i2.p1  ORF type:complete len:110 (+),score=35.60 TRINITY_DN3472_c1_g1_i2:32-361(+)